MGDHHDDRPRRYRNPNHPIAVQLREMPRIPKPSREEYDASLGSADAEIQSAKSRISDINAKLEATRTNNAGINKEVDAARAEFDKAKQALDEHMAGFKALKDKRDKARQNADNLKAKKAQQGKQRKPMKPEDIQKRIDDLEYRQETSSLTLREEKDIVAEMKQLRASLASLSDVDRSTRDLDAAFLRVRELNDQLTEMRKPIDGLRKTKDDAYKAMQSLREKRGANPAKKLLQERDELRQTIRTANNQRRKIRTEFKKANDKYYTHIREVRRLQNKLRQEEDEEALIQEEQEKREKQQMLDQQEPWQEELGLCRQLIGFLDGFAPREARPTVQREVRDLTIESEGKKLKPLAKKTRDDTFVGGKKGKKGKKGGAKQQNRSSALPLDFATLAAFNKLHITVPTSREDVPQTIAAVKAKVQEYKDKPRPKRPVAFFGGDRVQTPYGEATVVTQRKNKVVVAIMGWQLAQGAKVRGYLQPTDLKLVTSGDAARPESAPATATAAATATA